MPARTDRGHLALAGVITRGRVAFGERIGIVEEELLVVENIHHDPQIVAGCEPCRLLTRGVEDAVFAVQRRREQAARTPLERLLGAVRQFHDHAAAALKHIEDFVEHVLLRRRTAAGRHFQHEDRHPVAAAIEMHEGAAAFVAKPGPGADVAHRQVDAEILMDRNAFFGGPFEIGVEQEFRLRVHAGSFWMRVSSKYLPIFEGTPVLASSCSQVLWMRGSWSS